jgi:formylglycine-generating enzyme required for sulfatase activity
MHRLLSLRTPRAEGDCRYAAFLKATRRKPPFRWSKGKLPEGKDNLPVVNVTWEEVGAFCRWEAKRLPTEAEWERASRGIAEGAQYPWGDRAPTAKDARYDAVDGPGPVRRFPKNYFGLCDMSGNVWEWLADWYGRDYYQSAPDSGSQGPDKGHLPRHPGRLLVRPAQVSRILLSWARPGERSPTIGFR